MADTFNLDGAGVMIPVPGRRLPYISRIAGLYCRPDSDPVLHLLADCDALIVKQVRLSELRTLVEHSGWRVYPTEREARLAAYDISAQAEAEEARRAQERREAAFLNQLARDDLL